MYMKRVGLPHLISTAVLYASIQIAQKEELLMIIHVSACLNNLEESEKQVITGNWTWGRWQCSDY